MGYWGQGEGRLPTVVGVSVTAHASANTKGAWSQLVAALGHDVEGFMLRIDNGNDALTTAFLLDLGVGAAGSEQVLVPDIMAYFTAPTGGSIFFIVGRTAAFFPVSIPKGTRVSMRCQASTGSRVLAVSVLWVTAGFRGGRGLGRATAYGVTTSTSKGTSMTIPASGTGSWVQLVASTTYPSRALAIFLCPSTAMAQHVAFTVEWALGGSGAEKSLGLAPLTWRPATVYCQSGHFIGAYPCVIPAGTRLAARIIFGGGTGGDVIQAAAMGFS